MWPLPVHVVTGSCASGPMLAHRFLSAYSTRYTDEQHVLGGLVGHLCPSIF